MCFFSDTIRLGATARTLARTCAEGEGDNEMFGCQATSGARVFSALEISGGVIIESSGQNYSITEDKRVRRGVRVRAALQSWERRLDITPRSPPAVGRG